MKIYRNKSSGTGALNVRFGFAIVILTGIAWMATPTIAQEGGKAIAKAPSVPEVFEKSLYVPKAEAESQVVRGPTVEYVVEQTVSPGGALPEEAEDRPGTWDPALDDGLGGQLATTPEQFLTADPTFEGISSVDTGFNPPDTQGDVGPNHYIQVVNSAFEIWDKAGTSLTGHTNINDLWEDVSDAQAACRDSNSGDPIVLYDHLADVWVITKFTRPHFAPSLDIDTDPDWQCIAVSRGPDPVNDGWYLYQFAMVDEYGANFSHDYPKFGVWPDGYYMGSQAGFDCCDLNIVIFDRANMINGNPADSQSLDAGGNPSIFWLPADLDGPPPPAGTPGYIARQVDSAYYGVGGSDRIEIQSVNVDWANPANTALGAVQAITVLDFEETLCGGGNPGLFQYCIPQPGVVSQLEALTVWPMFKLQYRNFGDRDTLVFNHTVNADGNGTAGVRWYELERATPGTGAWTLRQQGTYSPQNSGNSKPEHRFMGSIAMDRFGNMALGYSVSSANLVTDGDAVDGYPSIRYTGREDDAPLGLMPEVEVIMAQGTQSRDEDGISSGPGDPVSSVRWGDYSSMTVDPVDDCTFWYTQEYLTLANNSWSTRIAAFSFAECSADLRVTKSATPSPATAGLQITYTINVHNSGVLDATNVIVTDTLPSGFTFIADNLPGSECADTTEPTIVCNVGDLSSGASRSFTITAAINSAHLQPGGADTSDNLVEVEADQADPDESNNTFTLSTLVNELADLSVTKTCKPDRDAVVGEDAPFCEIVVSNSGPSMARNVTLVDAITANGVYTIDNIDTAQGSCSDVGGDVECDLGDIDAGDSVLVTVHVLTELAIDINDIATVATDTPESDYSNNDATGQIHFTVASADLLVTKQCEPSGLTAPTGSDAFCEIFVYNNGPSTAVDVQLDDQIASDGSYDVTAISTSAGTCSATGTDVDVLCELGDIASGDTVSVVVTFTSNAEVDVDDIATATSVTDDPDPNNNTATGSVTFAGADVLVTKQCLPVEPAMAGSTASCEIFVYNNGPSPAQGVVLDDQIASNGNYDVTAISTSAGSCSATGSNVDVSCDLGDIAAGVTVSIVVEFTSIESIDINDIATATSTSVDSDPNNNTATGSVTFVAVSDLSIAKQANLLEVPAGTNLIYTLTVTNDGPSVAESVVVSDQVPAGVLMISATPSTGSCVMGVPGNAAQPTLCGMGDFAIGQQETVVIEVAVLPDATGLLHNDASVSSDTLDDNNGNNQVTTDTTVIVVTDLWVTKTDDQDPVFAGTNLKYVITVGNNGPSTATMVTLIDSLPAETSWVKTKVLGGAAACLQSGANPDEVTCTLADLGPGDTFVVVITVLVDPLVPDGTTITNLAEVFLDGVLDTSASEDTEVAASADLWIDKTGNFITENPSKTIRYTLTVHNDAGCSGDDPQVCGSGGPSDAQDVVVFDQLPSTNKKLRVSFVSEDCLYDYGSHTVTCTMQTPLAAGDSVFFEIEAQPKGRLRAITNTASVSSSTPDPDTGNNTDDMLIIVSGGGQK